MQNPEAQSGSRALTVYMILSMVMWGISWPSNKVLTSFGSAIDLGFFRYFFVVLSLFPLLFVIKSKVKISRKALPFLIVSGVLMAVYNYLFLQGLKNGTPGKGGILVTTLNPVMAYALGMLVDWRRPSKNEAIGLIIGIAAGCTLLEVWEGGDSLLDAGNLFFLLAAFTWSVMSKFTAQSGKFGSPVSFSWWMYVVTLCCILPFMNYGNVGRLFHSHEAAFWGNLLFSSVIVTTVATTMYFFATAKIGAERASSFIFTVPVSAALASWIIGGEIIEPHTIAGGLLGIAAVYVINKKLAVQKPA